MILKLPFFSKKKEKNIKPMVLVILDGFGIAPPSQGNAVEKARTPNIDFYMSNFPSGKIIASGESVGLPANEVGNTEVGHLTLGAGRVIYQELKRINIAIEKGYFFDNRAFVSAASHVRKNNSKLHIMGLIGTGQVHSSVEHLKALIQFCKRQDLQNVYLHLFTDGRDSPPKQGAEVIENIESILKNIGVGKIASLHGRYYAMDRDRRWNRTQRTYQALVQGKGVQAKSAIDAIKSSYSRGITDEFIEPTVIIKDDSVPLALIEHNDAVIFYNFRIDRPRQLTMAFVRPDFENIKNVDWGYDPDTAQRKDDVPVGTTFKREKVVQNLFFVTMTEYQKGLPVSAVAFGPEKVGNSLSQVLSAKALNQMHMAESEKERFVTYYFDGLREEKVEGEDVHIVQSPKVSTYDKAPEMSLPKLTSAFKKELSRDKYHFFVLNIANADMVAHSGILDKAIIAIEAIDKYLKQMVDAVLEVGGTVIVTADHGNAEEMLTFPSSTFFYTTSKGSVSTDHSGNPVPLILINKNFQGKKMHLDGASLADVAPTILGLMNLEIPKEMTGRYLLKP